MSDKKSITYRCDADILEALDNLGRERYHAKTPHGYDRSKILMDILRLNIEALSDGSIVLPGVVEVRQSASDNLKERITEIIKASGAIEQIRAEVKTDLRAELGKWSSRAIATMNHERQELRAPFGQLADREKELSLFRKAWKDSLTLL
jgi:uncharacterized hydantoinase/oxoprolinase family protein